MGGRFGVVLFVEIKGVAKALLVVWAGFLEDEGKIMRIGDGKEIFGGWNPVKSGVEQAERGSVATIENGGEVDLLPGEASAGSTPSRKGRRIRIIFSSTLFSSLFSSLSVLLCLLCSPLFSLPRTNTVPSTRFPPLLRLWIRKI